MSAVGRFGWVRRCVGYGFGAVWKPLWWSACCSGLRASVPPYYGVVHGSRLGQEVDASTSGCAPSPGGTGYAGPRGHGRAHDHRGRGHADGAPHQGPTRRLRSAAGRARRRDGKLNFVSVTGTFQTCNIVTCHVSPALHLGALSFPASCRCCHRCSRAQAVSGPTPIVVGFGVSTRKHVLDLHAAGADGVVVGSYLVNPTPATHSILTVLKAAEST